MNDHWFWLLLTAACVLWYSSVTIYVAIKGVGNIRTMLTRLGSGRGSDGANKESETGGK